LRRHQQFGLFAGPAVAAILLLSPVPEDLSVAGWRTLAVAALMAVWWATEALPVAATALLPIVLMPLLGVAAVDQVAAPYANPVIFLFLGGFLLALAIERWSLHRRMALIVLLRAGARPGALIAGFMGTTAFLSMWISNSASTMLMLPIAVSVLGKLAPQQDGEDTRVTQSLGACLLLAVAYSASLGGLGTLIGTPPNALLAGYMAAHHQIEIGFARWMLLALPIVLLMLPIVWFLLTRIVFPLRQSGDSLDLKVLQDELESLGPMTVPEKRVAAVFLIVALLWVARPLLQTLPGLELINDAGIAICGGVLLFVLPSGSEAGGRLLTWQSTGRLPWSVLLLFGGGLSLALGLSTTGVTGWLGQSLQGAAELPFILIAALTVLTVLFLTELTSNTATTAAFLPAIAALAVAIGQPVMMLAVPAALAASCAFMLPVATPPNAIVFSSGRVSIPQMLRAGLWLNLICASVILLAAEILVPLLFRA